jgi:hypothetical protein
MTCCFKIICTFRLAHIPYLSLLHRHCERSEAILISQPKKCLTDIAGKVNRTINQSRFGWLRTSANIVGYVRRSRRVHFVRFALGISAKFIPQSRVSTPTLSTGALAKVEHPAPSTQQPVPNNKYHATFFHPSPQPIYLLVLYLYINTQLNTYATY